MTVFFINKKAYLTRRIIIPLFHLGCAKASNFIRHVAATTPETEKSSKRKKIAEGSWKAVVRTKVSPEKPLRSMRHRNPSEYLTSPFTRLIS